MSQLDIVYRYTERYTEKNAVCRGCDKSIVPKTEKVIATYSKRNRGQWIYFCRDCVNEMFGLVLKDDGISSFKHMNEIIEYMRYKNKHEQN